MALGSTHKVLAVFRDSGYTVNKTRDSTGRACWSIEYPRMTHDFDTGLNVITNVYVGKVEKYGSPEIGNWSPLGRPFFYHTNHPEVEHWDCTQDAIRIARNSGATIRPQF